MEKQDNCKVSHTSTFFGLIWAKLLNLCFDSSYVPQSILASLNTLLNTIKCPLELYFSLHKCPKPFWQGCRPGVKTLQKQANAYLNLDNSSKRASPKCTAWHQQKVSKSFKWYHTLVVKWPTKIDTYYLPFVKYNIQIKLNLYSGRKAFPIYITFTTKFPVHWFSQ